MYRLPNIKVFVIVITVVCLSLSGICIYNGIKAKKSCEKRVRECTSSAEGVIEKVDTYSDYSDDTVKYEYRYTILFTTNDRKSGRYITRKTGLKYKEGEKVTVCYDPDNFKTMFSDIDRPSSGIAAFIMAGVVPFFGLAAILTFKRSYRKLGALRR